jgi:hypothetical protein
MNNLLCKLMYLKREVKWFNRIYSLKISMKGKGTRGFFILSKKNPLITKARPSIMKEDPESNGTLMIGEVGQEEAKN